LSITGSPITSSGTLAIGLSGTALPTTSGGTGLTSFTANGVVYASSSSALTTGSALTFDGTKLVNTGYNKSAYQVSTGAVSTFESVGGGYLSYDGAGGASVYSRLDATTENTLTFRATAFSFRVAGTQVVSLNSSTFSLHNIPILLSGSTSGYTGFAAPATSNFTIYTLPSADGTSGQSLTTNGSGTLSWASGTGGTVTSVSGTGTVSGISLSGTVTSSGNLTLGGALDLSAYSGAGAFTTLSASSTVTLSGGTANGVTYLNGSKVVTSGSALTFDGTNFAVGTNSPVANTPLTLQALSGYTDILWLKSVGTNIDSRINIAPTGTGVAQLNNTNGTPIAFQISGSEGMRLTSTGLGIGTSSPAHKLDVATASGDCIIRLGNGTSQARFALDSDGPYIYALTSGDNALRVFTPAGSQAMTLDASGNLGVGTTSINTRLHVVGLNQTNGTAEFTPNASKGSNASYVHYGTNGDWYIRSASASGNVNIQDTGGNVGIGTSSPSNKLHVYNTVNSNSVSTQANFQDGGTTGGLLYQHRINVQGKSGAASLQVGTTDSSSSHFNGQACAFFAADTLPMYLFQGSNQPMLFATNGTERARIDSSGNLGIGTTSPTAKLHVSGDAIANTFKLIANTTVSGSDATIFRPADNTMAFSTNGSERARIDSSGNLLVGTTSQPVGTSRIAVVTTGNTQAAMLVNDTYNYASAITWNKATANNNSFIEFGTEGTYTARGTISYNRGAGLVAYNTTSDYRAKDISGPVTGSGALIDSVPVYMGKMKDATQERPMFIAHETPAYAHTGEKDAVDADGNPVYQQMDASALIPVMWAEIQSLRKRLADAGI